MTTPSGSGRTYTALDAEAQDAAKKRRIYELEVEHYDNVLALQQRQARPSGTPEEDEANAAEISRLQTNIEIIESSLNELDPQ